MAVVVTATVGILGRVCISYWMRSTSAELRDLLGFPAAGEETRGSEGEERREGRPGGRWSCLCARRTWGWDIKMDLGGWRAMFEPKNFRGTKYSKGEKAYASWRLWEWGLNVRGSRARATPTQGDHQEGGMLMSDINETRSVRARGT